MADAEDSWKALSQANDWIKIADAKAGFVIAADGVLGGLLVRALPAHEVWLREPWKFGLLLTGIVLVSTSALTSLQVFAPRLRVGEAPSLLYFDHVARCFHEPEQFGTPYRAMLGTQDLLEKSLANEFWAVSTVAHRKFRWVRRAIWLLGVAVPAAAGGGIMPC